MIDRKIVERIHKNAAVAIGSGMDMWLPPEQIAELCRVYLAYLDAPAVKCDRVSIHKDHATEVVHVDYKRARGLSLSEWLGKRVRLVPDAEEKCTEQAPDFPKVP